MAPRGRRASSTAKTRFGKGPGPVGKKVQISFDAERAAVGHSGGETGERPLSLEKEEKGLFISVGPLRREAHPSKNRKNF